MPSAGIDDSCMYGSMACYLTSKTLQLRWWFLERYLRCHRYSTICSHLGGRETPAPWWLFPKLAR